MKLDKILHDLAFRGHADGRRGCGWHQSVADRRCLLLLSRHNKGVDELASEPDFHSLRPLPGAPKMSGFKNDTYGITGNPYYGWRGVGLCKERV